MEFSIQQLYLCKSLSFNFLPSEDNVFISYPCMCFKNFGLTPSSHILRVAAALACMLRILVFNAFFITDAKSSVSLVSPEHYFLNFFFFIEIESFTMLC